MGRLTHGFLGLAGVSAVAAASGITAACSGVPWYGCVAIAVGASIPVTLTYLGYRDFRKSVMEFAGKNPEIAIMEGGEITRLQQIHNELQTKFLSSVQLPLQLVPRPKSLGVPLLSDGNEPQLEEASACEPNVKPEADTVTVVAGTEAAAELLTEADENFEEAQDEQDKHGGKA